MSSLYSVTDAAVFRPAVPPRDGVVEFGGRLTTAVPIRAAIPVLSRAHGRDDLHPSVALLTGAVLLGLRLVAAGRIEPDRIEPGEECWRAVVDGDDVDRVRQLARTRAYGELDVAAAEQLVRGVLDAVADAMPRAAPAPERRRAAAFEAGGFQERLRARLARHVTAPTGLPQLVSVSLRVEADEEELVGGSIRLVPQVHDDADPLHVADAARLWQETWEQHGFGERARTHALVALRGAAQVWPVLDR
ncbi:MAG TPA: ATP-dependent helicase, partial [Nocardioides sp.]|nr:ATP-dependent helicase [Nocardioides sp.]